MAVSGCGSREMSKKEVHGTRLGFIIVSLVSYVEFKDEDCSTIMHILIVSKAYILQFVTLHCQVHSLLYPTQQNKKSTKSTCWYCGIIVIRI